MELSPRLALKYFSSDLGFILNLGLILNQSLGDFKGTKECTVFIIVL